jgi:ABC-type arginine transport system ATPase subunit
VIRLHGVSKSFGALQVLNDVTCAVGAGERVALAAPDGDHVTLGQLGQEYAELEQEIAAREAEWVALVEAGEG